MKVRLKLISVDLDTQERKILADGAALFDGERLLYQAQNIRSYGRVTAWKYIAMRKSLPLPHCVKTAVERQESYQNMVSWSWMRYVNTFMQQIHYGQWCIVLKTRVMSHCIRGWSGTSANLYNWRLTICAVYSIILYARAKYVILKYL